MRKLCLYAIIIHTNFHQNWSINEYVKWSFMTLVDLLRWYILWNICVFIMMTFLKRFGVKEKIDCRKRCFIEILRWPHVTFNDLWGHTSVIKKIVFIMLAFIGFLFIKISSKINVLLWKKSRNHEFFGETWKNLHS